MSSIPKIGQSEAIALLVTAVTTKVFLTYPSAIYRHGGSAGWMITLLSVIVTCGLLLAALKLIQRFPQQTFPQLVEKTVGPFFGGMFIFTALISWLVEVSSALRRFSELIITVALPETTISIVSLVFIVTALIVAYLGIQTIARACYLSFPFIYGAFFLILVLTYPSWNLDWLFPLLGSGVVQILKHGVYHSSDFIEINLIYLLPLLFYAKEIKSISYKTVGISAIILLTATIVYGLVYPATVAQEAYIPLYSMARGVYLGRFLQRIEAVFVLFWIVAGYLWIAMGLFGFSQLLTDTLRLPDYRPLLIPSAILMFTIAFIPANLPSSILLSDLFRKYAFIPTFGIPAILLLVAVIRGKGSQVTH